MSFPDFLARYNATSGNVMFAAEHQPIRGDNVLCGLFTLGNFLDKHRAQIGVWLEPKYRGVNSHHIGRQFLSYCHKNLSIDNLYGITPWRHAVELCERSGMIAVGEIPNYCKVGERTMDCYIYHSDGQIWRQELRQTLAEMGWQPNSADKLAAHMAGDQPLPIEAGYDA